MIPAGFRWLLLPALFLAVTDASAQRRGYGVSAAPSSSTNLFERTADGLPEAGLSQELVLTDGAVFDLTAAPVSKSVASKSLRMLAYNGCIPGPPLRVK